MFTNTTYLIFSSSVDVSWSWIVHMLNCSCTRSCVWCTCIYDNHACLLYSNNCVQNTPPVHVVHRVRFAQLAAPFACCCCMPHALQPCLLHIDGPCAAAGSFRCGIGREWWCGRCQVATSPLVTTRATQTHTSAR